MVNFKLIIIVLIFMTLFASLLSGEQFIDVAKTIPLNGSVNISTSTEISIQLNKESSISQISNKTLQIIGPDGNISGRVINDSASNSLIFIPSVALIPLSTYSVFFSTTIISKSGKNMTSDYSWSFKTGRDILERAATDAIPATFFGLHIFKSTSTTPWPSIKFGTWRLWNANVNWPNLEPLKGEWHFEVLDKYIALAKQNNIEIVLPLAYSPTWASARPSENPKWSPGAYAEPANINDWKNYVRAVVNRYKGRIPYYELWNEPNLSDFFSGNVNDMLTLAKEAYIIIKEVDPMAKVISPSATSVVSKHGDSGLLWLGDYLSKGGGSYADIIGFHFYAPAGTPESQLEKINSVKLIMAKYEVASKPLWNTETGWRTENRLTTVVSGYKGEPILTIEQASGFVARSYILQWAKGIDRFYWFGLDSFAMALMESDGKTMKEPAVAYNSIFEWLKGANMVSCGQNKHGVWVVRITRKDGYKAAIVWNSKEIIKFDLPKEWKAKSMKNLFGKKTIIATGTINIGPSPVIVESY